MRILSLAALTVLELPPADMVTCAAAAGYGHVGLRLVPATPSEPRYDTIGDTPLVREIRARLDDTGVRVLDVEILRLTPQAEVASFLPVLDTGARLGAANALVAGNDPDASRFADRFVTFCDRGLVTACREWRAQHPADAASGPIVAGYSVGATALGLPATRLLPVWHDALERTAIAMGATTLDEQHPLEAALFRFGQTARTWR